MWSIQLSYFSKFANLSSPYAQQHQADDSVFFSKLAAGTLEQVTFLKPSNSDSFNPSSSTIGGTSSYLQTAMQAILASPQYQAGTMLVYISFDHNAGLYDHVPPYRGDVDGPATRVPGIVISPDHAGGRVNSLPYDDMAFIQMLERRFNLTTILQPNRTAVTRDFTNSFDDITRPAQWNWTPEHVRTAFVVPGSHAVSYDTVDAYLPIGTLPRVFYGASPTTMTQVAVGNTTTYFGSSVAFHHVVLTGLQYHTTYYYTILFQNLTAVPYYTFTTVRAQGDSTNNQVIGLVGDLGWDPSAAATTSLMTTLTMNGSLDFWLHIGDLSYADTWPTHVNGSVYVYDQIFEIFMDNISPITQRLPYQVLPGNHEAACYSSKASACVILSNNFSSYDARWRMPGAESGGYRNMWYSFDSVSYTQHSTATLQRLNRTPRCATQTSLTALCVHPFSVCVCPLGSHPLGDFRHRNRFPLCSRLRGSVQRWTLRPIRPTGGVAAGRFGQGQCESSQRSLHHRLRPSSLDCHRHRSGSVRCMRCCLP